MNDNKAYVVIKFSPLVYLLRLLFVILLISAPLTLFISVPVSITCILVSMILGLLAQTLANDEIIQGLKKMIDLQNSIIQEQEKKMPYYNSQSPQDAAKLVTQIRNSLGMGNN